MSNLSHRKKIFKTISIVLVWVCIGLNLEITGPTLIDLKIITNTNYEDVSRAVSGRAFGFFIGAAIGGLLVEKLDQFCDVMLAICLDFIGIFGIVVPYLSSTSWMFFVILLQGTFEGIINIAGQKLVLELWKEKSTSPMHALHLGFGVGSLVVPQIADPFLAVLNDNEHQSANNDSITKRAESNMALAPSFVGSSYIQNVTTQRVSIANSVYYLHSNVTQTSILSDIAYSDVSYMFTTDVPTTVTANNSTNKIFLKETTVQWAYIIVAIVAFCVSMPFFCFQLCGKSFRDTKIQADKTKDPKLKDPTLVSMIDPKTCADGNRLYGLQVFSLLFLFCFQAFGGEYICGKFIRSFAIDTYNMDGDEASWLNTSFWISYTVGCFLGFITGRCVPIRKLLLIECVGMLLSTILFAIFAQKNTTFLWIFTQPVGAFIAPGFPMCMVWGDTYVTLTGFAITIICFGGSMGGFVYLWIVGHLYDSEGPNAFLYSCVVFGLLMCVFAFSLHLISIGKGTRYKKKETVPETNNVDYVGKVNLELENDDTFSTKF